MKINRKIIFLGLLAVFAFVSYHQLLKMYFWRDDYTGLYIAQQEDLRNQAEFAYPYHIALLAEKYAWQLFNLNASNFYLTVIILYITSAWLLFYFLNRLLKGDTIAFLCSLVFAAGYVGQDAMKMTMGDGLGTIMALNILLATLLTLLVYLQNGRKIWLIFSLIFFFLVLEIAPQRTSSFPLLILALDWIVSWKKRNFNLYLRNFFFMAIFLIQYFLHPSVWILGYKITPPSKFLGVLVDFSPLYLLNPLGIFWNLIVPSDLQENLNRIIGIYNQQLSLFRFWLAGLPSVFFAIFLLIYLKLIRGKKFSFLILGIIITFIFSFSVIWALVIYQNQIDKGDMVSILNGGILLLFVVIWIKWGGSKFKSLAILSLLAIFSIIVIFFWTIPERILVSYNRYLLLASFTPALLPIIFVTKEYHQKNLVKRRLAKLLFITVIFILVVPRLTFALFTQQIFVENYSQHARKMYQEIKFYIPDTNKKKVIYVNGVNKELDLSVGDAARVGYFGSEVAWAVNFKTKKENILLPQTLEDIPKLLEDNPEVLLEDVYTFLYDEGGIKNTSQITRKILSDQYKFK